MQPLAANIHTNLILAYRKVDSLTYFVAFFSGELHKSILFRHNRRRGRFGRSRSSNSVNLVPIESAYICDLSCTVSEIWQVLCAPDLPLFNPNFGDVPVALDRPCWGQPARAEALSYLAVKLFSKNCNLCDHDIPDLTDGPTDRRLTVASPRSALASRGKKCRPMGNARIFSLLAVCLPIRLSHAATLVLCQTDSSYDHNIVVFVGG